MTSQDLYALPPAWEAIFGRRAARGQAAAMIADARRYLGLNSPERVSDLRTVDTLRNLVHAYVEDADREAALLELAVARAFERPSQGAAATALAALAGTAVVGVLVLRASRRTGRG